MVEEEPQKVAALTDRLRGVRLLRALDDAARDRLAARATVFEIAPEDYVYRQGRPVDAIYVVLEGSFAVFRDAVGSPVQLLARLHSGDLIGHVGLVVRGEYAASVRATAPGRLARFSPSDFLQCLEENPSLRAGLEALVSREYSAQLAAILEAEQQREVRVRVHHPVHLEGGDGETFEAMLENLSIGGSCLHGIPETWKVGRVVHFRLQLKTGVLRLTGRIAWRRGDTAGLAFIEMTSHHDTIIQMAIHLLLDSAR